MSRFAHHILHYRHVPISFALIVLMLATSGCSTIGNLFTPTNPIEENQNRLAIISDQRDYSVDDSLANQALVVPAGIPIPFWQNEHGTNSHHIDNIAIEDFTFNNSATVDAGDGNDWKDGEFIPAPIATEKLVITVDAKGYIVARDITNIKKVVWQHKSAIKKRYSNNGGGLAYDGTHIFATLANGTVLSLSANDGKLIWQKDLMIPTHSAPQTSQKYLFVATANSQLFALNKRTGKIIWHHRGIDESLMISGNMIPATLSNSVAVSYPSGEIYSVDMVSGRSLWSDSLLKPSKTSASGAFSSAGGSPVIAGGLVLASSTGGLLSANAISGGARIWEREIPSSNTIWLSGHFLYILSSDNYLMSIYAPDGRIKWAVNIADISQDKNVLYSGPTMINSELILMGTNGDMLKILPTDGTLIHQEENIISDGASSKPAIAQNKLFIVTQNAKLHMLQ